MLPNFRVNVTPAGRRTVVAASGELDLATGPDLERALHEHLARGPVVLDIAGLTFMDSTGILVLKTALEAAASEGHELAVRPRLHENVRQVLQMTGMLGLVPFETHSREGTS